MNYTVDNYIDIFEEEYLDTKEEQIQALKDKDIIKYKTKTIVSGPMLECEIYPIWRTSKRSIREKRRRESRVAQQKLNNRNAVKRVIRLINTNFDNSDIWATFTYSDDMLPSSEDQAKKDMQNYIRRLKRYIEKEKLDSLKYIYVTEYQEGKRIHHHIVMNFKDRDTAERIWKNGGRTQTRRLQPDDYGLEGLARYITKDSKGSKRYTCSKNLEKPRIYEAYSKFSKRRAEKIAVNPDGAKELFEKIYKDYIFNDIDIKYSEFVSGCYIYVRLRKAKRYHNDKE
jgi:hypothetical protein